jgi:hypothetical protein
MRMQARERSETASETTDAAPVRAADTGPVIALQRAAGNRATAKLLTRLRHAPRSQVARLPVLDPPGPLLPGAFRSPLLMPPDLMPRPVDTAMMALLDALEPLRGRPELDDAWDRVISQVKSPRTRKKPPAGAPAGLYDARTVESLAALTPGPSESAKTRAEKWRDQQLIAAVAFERKQEVINRVFDVMLVERELALGNPPPVLDLEAEWGILCPVHDCFNEPSVEYYATVRRALLREFGALRDGTQAALKRILTYYRELEDTTLLGRKVHNVHRDMVMALSRAQGLLGFSPAPQIGNVGGANIRTNANDAYRLSEHSFGAAIDIDGATSPNIPGFPFDFVADVTGVDARLGRAGKPFEHNLMEDDDGRQRSFAEIEAEAERLKAASDTLQAAFADESGLADALYSIALRRGARVEPGQRGSLLDAAVAAAQERTRAGKPIEWAYDQIGPTDPRSPSAARQALAQMLFPRDVEVTWEPGNVHDTVELLSQMASTFEDTYVHDAKGRRKRTKAGDLVRVPATARSPSLAQIAYHGFMSVPPVVVAALSSREGGNLRWLGGTPGTRDFMHFELKDRPRLY